MIPHFTEKGGMADMDALLEVRNLTKLFPKKPLLFAPDKRSMFAAVEDVSFSLQRGEALGLVGESGCGKTTIANLILKLLSPDRGEIIFDGEDITQLKAHREILPVRRKMQAVFQNSGSSLDPHMTLGKIITEPLKNFGLPIKGKAEQYLELVSLPPDWVSRKPHQLSGGQRQRVSIARAMVLKPKLLILDEPTSNLDVLTASQILALLRHLFEEHETAVLFISHDIAAVDKLCRRKAVMKDGRIIETLSSLSLEEASHPYTKKLIESKLSIDKS
jgi:ABC-type glutathione transport system ATPase component